MIRKILEIRDQKLRGKSKFVQKFDKKLERLLRDLKDTIDSQRDPEGVGLAAPQIGAFRRVFVVKQEKRTLEFVNPEIIWFSKKTNEPKVTTKSKEQTTKGGKAEKEAPYYMEGCLSMPNYYGPVKRVFAVRVKYQSPEGDKLVEKEEEFSGFVAQVIQHEFDHLEGVLFVDRLLEQKRNLYKLHGEHWHEVELLP